MCGGEIGSGEGGKEGRREGERGEIFCKKQDHRL